MGKLILVLAVACVVSGCQPAEQADPSIDVTIDGELETAATCETLSYPLDRSEITLTGDGWSLELINRFVPMWSATLTRGGESLACTGRREDAADGFSVVLFCGPAESAIDVEAWFPRVGADCPTVVAE